MCKKYVIVLIVLLMGLYNASEAMRFDSLIKENRICAITTLRKDTKEFIDSIASCNHPESLYMIRATVFVGNKTVKVLQYQDDLDIFGDPEKPECSLMDRTNGIALDRIDKTFILKCYPKQKEESAIREAVGSYIGAALKSPIHKVKIIPASIDFVGKKVCSIEPCLATLHTYVPGTEIASLDNKNLYIRGGLSHEYGFEAATNNTEICDIIILDICADNGDRHNGNFRCFNNHYYAYDMDETFNGCLHGSVACQSSKFLQDFLPAKYLNRSEKKMLVRVQQGLKKFLRTFPHDVLYNVWMEKASQAEYTYSDSDKKYLKEQCVQHRKEIKDLIKLIETFTNT